MEDTKPEQELPTEILNEIFDFAVPSFMTFGDIGTLLDIGLVCHAWRVALSPRWSRLRVELQPEEDIPCKKIRSLLANAGPNAPKTLQLHILYIAGTPVCMCSDSTSTLLCQWAKPEVHSMLLELQLQGLSLRFSRTPCFQTLMDGIKAQVAPSTDGPILPWSSLRSVRLHFGYEYYPSQGPHAIFKYIFAELPHSLENLHLELWHLITNLSTTNIVDIPSPTFPSNLKSLKINCKRESSLIVSILRHCVNLEKLRLATELVLDHEGDGGQVVLPKVHTLKLGNATLLQNGKYFEHIHLPSVVHFTMDYGFINISGQKDIDIGLDILRRSRSGQALALRSLKLKCCSFEDTAILIGALASLPSLEKVVLDSVAFSAEAFLRHQSQVTEKLLPSLQHFELLRFNSAFDFNLGSFFQYIKSRRKHSKDDGNMEFRDPPDSLHYVLTSYSRAATRCRALWERCSDIVRELQVDFGVVVEIFCSD